MVVETRVRVAAASASHGTRSPAAPAHVRSAPDDRGEGPPVSPRLSGRRDLGQTPASGDRPEALARRPDPDSGRGCGGPQHKRHEPSLTRRWPLPILEPMARLPRFTLIFAPEAIDHMDVIERKY